jgi:hypothetical protein
MEEKESQSFDLRTHIRDPKRGVVVRKQPYRLEIVDGVRTYIRDGLRYHEDGTLVAGQISEAEPKLGAVVGPVSKPKDGVA